MNSTSVTWSSLSALYRGEVSWAGLWTSWAVLSPSYGRPWNSGTYYVATVILERRRGRTPLLTGRGRTSRSRASAETRARKSARLAGLEWRGWGRQGRRWSGDPLHLRD